MARTLAQEMFYQPVVTFSQYTSVSSYLSSYITQVFYFRSIVLPFSVHRIKERAPGERKLVDVETNEPNVGPRPIRAHLPKGRRSIFRLWERFRWMFSAGYIELERLFRHVQYC